MFFRRKHPEPANAKNSRGSTPSGPDSVSAPLPRELYLQLADEYAHYCSLSIQDGPEQKEREQMLLAGGKNAQSAITEFLICCGRGQAKYGWWGRAADLTRLLRRIGSDDAEKYLYELKNIRTSIWEYHTQVLEVADQELLEMKKAVLTEEQDIIPREDAAAELRLLYNSGKTTAERIHRAIEMLPSVEYWSDSDKGFYYYIIGDALKRRDEDDERRIPFYAAQVYYQPEAASLGWTELKKSIPQLKEMPVGSETAGKLVRVYPLPETLEELLDS